MLIINPAQRTWIFLVFRKSISRKKFKQKEIKYKLNFQLYRKTVLLIQNCETITHKKCNMRRIDNGNNFNETLFFGNIIIIK